MDPVTIHHAKTQLSRLIEAAMRGEDVIIAKGKQPMVRLVPVTQGTFQVGILAGMIDDGLDFLSADPDDELALWEGDV